MNTGFDFETFLEDWLAPLMMIAFIVFFIAFIMSPGLLS